MDIFADWLLQRPIAHRGLHNDEFPEQSLGAFQNAVDHGFTIELDVRELDDGTLAVFHDAKLSRMTGADGYISKLKREDLTELRLAGSDYCIPTLEEVFSLVAGKVPLLIEIKSDGDAAGSVEARLLQALKGYVGEYAVQSFNPYSLGYFFAHAPEIARGQLAARFSKEEMPSFARRFALTRMLLNRKVSHPHFISYRHDDLPCRFVTRKDLPVLAWTVQSAEEAAGVKPYCDNIIFEGFIPEV